MKYLIGIFLMLGALVVSPIYGVSRDSKASPLVVILMGPPGSGKGTHASALSKKWTLPHISTGDLFRDHIQNQTSLGIQAKQYIDKGNLVPDEVVLDILLERIAQKDCKMGYILDGFPRTIAQAQALDARLGNKYQILILNLELSDQSIVERIVNRLICKDCQRPFHKIYDPPQKELVCDACQGGLYQREDDKVELVKQRLQVYHEQTKPLVDYYAKKKGAFYPINSQLTKTKVFEEILKVMPSEASPTLSQ